MRETVSSEIAYGEVLAGVEYPITCRGRDFIGIKYKGGTRYIPKTHISRKKIFTKDNEDNLPTYEEIILEETKDFT